MSSHGIVQSTPTRGPSRHLVPSTSSRNRSDEANGPNEAIDSSRLALEAALVERDKLQTRVEETELALAAKDGRIRVLSSEVAAARREWDRAKKNAKFDHAAREGQTKKLVILEHNITTLRHDLQTTMERSQKLEEQTATLERVWQNERSLRLQDLHRHDTISLDARNAEREAEVAEKKWLAAEQRVKTLESTLGSNGRDLEARRRIEEAQQGEIDAQVEEIELLKTEILGLKSTLLTAKGEISEGRATTSDLRRELSRVRRDYIVSTSNRSEQHSALLGGRRQGISLQQSRSISGGKALGGDRQTGEWATGMISTPARKIPPAVPRLTSSTPAGSREGGSWDGMFISKLNSNLVNNPEKRRRSLRNQGRRDVDDKIVHSHASGSRSQDRTNLCDEHGRSSDPRNTINNNNNNNNKDNDNKNNSDQEGPMKTSINTCSTLHVSGSLFIGTGLGVRKKLACVSPGGTAKEILQKILEDHDRAQKSRAAEFELVAQPEEDD